jgi:hypothetical protein
MVPSLWDWRVEGIRHDSTFVSPEEGVSRWLNGGTRVARQCGLLGGLSRETLSKGEAADTLTEADQRE